MSEQAWRIRVNEMAHWSWTTDPAAVAAAAELEYEVEEFVPSSRLAAVEAERDEAQERSVDWHIKADGFRRERDRLWAERDEARGALLPFTRFDFHATQWLTAAEGGALLDSEGNELRGVPAGVIDDLIAYVKDARAALRPSEPEQGPADG